MCTPVHEQREFLYVSFDKSPPHLTRTQKECAQFSCSTPRFRLGRPVMLPEVKVRTSRKNRPMRKLKATETPRRRTISCIGKCTRFTTGFLNAIATEAVENAATRV